LAQQSAATGKVLVSITDKQGYAPEIELRDRLQITLDKQSVKVVSVKPATDLPVHIAIMIDKSGRTTQLINQEQEAATAFLNRFARPELDRPFTMNVAEGAPNMTTSRNYADFRAALSRHGNLSGESVINGLKSYMETVTKMYGEKFPARRAAILFSNGGTQVGQDFIPKLREFVISNKITFFIVNTDWTGRYFGMNSAGLLQEIAEDTGGTYEDVTNFNSRSVNLDQLPDILNHLGAVIRNQQEITFEAVNPGDKLHSLNVHTAAPTLVLHAPRYYMETKRERENSPARAPGCR
jgi:hypothetical protein